MATDHAAPADAAAAPPFRLMYRSHSLMPPASLRADLGTLFSKARAANKAQQISGALLRHGDHFCQVLEGDEPRVQALFERIREDPRHDDVELISAESVEARVFARWSMAQVTADGDVPLIAHVDGIAPAAGHPTTAEQRQVMDVMRSAVTRSHQS